MAEAVVGITVAGVTEVAEVTMAEAGVTLGPRTAIGVRSTST